MPMSPLFFFFLVFANIYGPPDKCHVYLVDRSEEAISMVEKALENAIDPEEMKAIAAQVVKILGKFDTIVGEEESTTRSYPIPKTDQFVTATVFYTDESMPAEKVGYDSMILSLAIANRSLDSAQGAPGASQAELSIGRFAGKARVKKATSIVGKEYLLGLECECSQKEVSSVRIPIRN